ncbi:MAG: AP endonuclease [Candidatus Hydrogenedentota bacterium]
MQNKRTRREFMKTTGAGIAAAAVASAGLGKAHAARDYSISLAGWSLHRTIGVGEGKTPMLDMPKLAREEWDIGGIELVNNMLPPKDESFANMKPYLDQLAKNAAFHNVRILLIMVDGQGNIGGTEQAQRDEAVEKHSKWIDIAEYMGCHSIRMNWAGAPHEVVKDEAALAAFIDRSVPGFQALCEYGDTKDINVIIENHGGASSYPAAMEQLMAAVDHPRFGTLPDFGNFPEDVDLYDAIDRLMVFAKAVSAKCYDFDDTTGDETKLDFPRIIENVVDKHGYHGYIGIEFEGDRLTEHEGIRRCKALLDRLKA